MKNDYNFELQKITPEDTSLAYTSRNDPANCIGHLRGYLDKFGNMPTSWFGHHDNLKTPWFHKEFNALVGWLHGTILKDRKSLLSFTWTEADMLDGLAIGIDDGRGSVVCKILTDQFTYYVRLCPEPGDYNVYIYCYTNTAESYGDGIEIVKVTPRQPWQSPWRVYTNGIHEATLDTLEQAREYARGLLNIQNEEE